MNLPCLVSTTVKTEKTETKYQDWLNALTYLYPNKILCPNSLQCFDDCLKASGRLTMNKKKWWLGQNYFIKTLTYSFLSY